MPYRVYRLTIRNAADTADAFVVTSLKGGTAPFIVNPPSGDGQEVDLLTGAMRTGAYVVEVADLVLSYDTTGTVRAVTNVLEDAVGRQQLLSRRAYIDVSDDGVTYGTRWQAGYVTQVRQVDAITYAFTISDTRRIEQTKQVFTWQTAAERTAFPKRGCVLGGPVITGLGGGTVRTVDSGGWEFAYRATTGTAGSPVEGDTIALKYVAGAFPPLWERKVTPGPTQKAWVEKAIKPLLAELPGDASASGADFADLRENRVWGSPEVLAIVTNLATGSEWLGSLRGFPLVFGKAYLDPSQYVYVELLKSETSWPALPSADTRLRVRLVTRQVSEWSPLYIQAHPVDIAASLYTLIDLPVNAAAQAATKSALGDTLLLTARITEATTMTDFLEKSLFGPFGFSAQINSTGEVAFFTTRARGSVAPSVTVTNNDLVGDAPPPIFELDETTAVTGFTVSQQLLVQQTFTDDDPETFSPDGIAATTQPVQYLSGDTSTYATRMVSYDIPGMVTDAASFVSEFTPFAQGIAFDGFNRFGRGAPSGEFEVVRTATAATLQVGDFAYLSASYYPNKNYRIGESSVGARVVQIVRREERPQSVVFKAVDAGPFVQPATAATISVAQSAADSRRVAAFTITNAATLNAGSIGVAVEYATGSSTPTQGQVFTRYEGGSVPIGAVNLPPVVPGTRVWVRARSEQAGRFPTAWSAWANVTLASWVAPTGVTVGTLTNQTAVVSWSLNGNTTDSVDVYVAPGSVAPSDWTPYRQNTLPAQSTTTALTGLTASTAYIVGVAFRDEVAKIGQSPATATFTTAGTTTGTCRRPAGVAVIEGANDASLQQGVAIALWAAEGEESIVVERGTSAGGPFTEIAVVSATTEVYVDALPSTATTYYYRLLHRTSGKADSSPTPVVSALATGVLTNITRPPAVSPTITPSTTGEATLVSVTLTLDDPQNRVELVQFRTLYHGGAWSAWATDSTVPYSASVNVLNDGITSSVGWRIIGYDNDGIYYDTSNPYRQGESSWPLNLGVNPTVNKLTRSRYNSGTGKYEIWYRYFIELGNDELLEDPILGFVTSSGPVPASILDQSGNVATGLYYDPVKQTDGWRVEWDSTASQQWTFELASYGAYEELIFPYQDSDNQTTPFPVTTGSATFVVPAGGSGGSGDVVADDTSTTVQNIVAYNTTGGKNITELTGTQGDVLYHNGTSWAKLPAGTSGQFLKTNGAAANPAWATVTAGSGDVVGDDTTTTVQNIVAYNSTGGKNITELTGTQGDVLYHNGTSWVKLAAGTAGNFLKTNGAGANPQWAAASVSAANVTAGTFPGATYTFSDTLNVTSDLTVDTNLLVTDSTNNRIGINQATPLYALDVTGTARVTGTTTFNGLTYTWPGSQTANYYLQTNGSGTLSWAAAGGGSDPWTYKKLTTPYTTTSATLATISAGGVALEFTPAANTHYEFEGMLMLRTSTNTNNPRTGIAWPTGMSNGVVFMNQTGAAATTGVYTAGNIAATVQVAVGGLPNNTQDWPCFIKGVIAAGATPGSTLRVQMAAETAGGTMTVQAGSFLKYRTI